VWRFRRERLGPHWDRKFMVFWNNRNARRKMSGDVIDIFAKFAQRVGRENVSLVMQTQSKDPEGQDLVAIAKKFKIDANLVLSEGRVSPDDLNMLYNAADATINIASAEGFGLGTLESMMAGTPILVHMTGGLQFQIGDWWEGVTDFSDQDVLTELAKKKWNKKEGKWWGVPVFPSSRSCTGSQPIPYIYDDRASHEDVVRGLERLYKMGRDERKKLGLESREWAVKTFNMERMITNFDALLTKTLAEFRPVSEPRIVTL
jgi:glycosyltransferase involved in cell wall biosynthesis